MCLQDLRISRRLSIRVITIAGNGSGVAVPIDLSRVAMIVADQSAGSVYPVSNPNPAVVDQLVADNDFSNLNGELLVFTRESMGGSVSSPCWLWTDAIGDVVVKVHEYDAETMHEICSPTLKG